jgi:carbamoyl-phosphate synthase small subunit
MAREKIKAVLVLSDGTMLQGYGFGAEGEAIGEVVFHTGMTGYQEILTDPSYHGQIVTMTYSQIGNTGINPEDMESSRVWVQGYILREYQDYPSNFRSKMTLHEFLKQHRVVGIDGIDTRFLTRKLRSQGSQPGIISTMDFDRESLLDKLGRDRGILGIDMASEVSCSKPYDFYEGSWRLSEGHKRKLGEPRFKAVCLDFGIKTNILRMLCDRGIFCRVMPAKTGAEQILAENPDGVVLSNGPGDPSACTYAAEAVRQIVKARPELPVLGICLGHQILGHAFGGNTIKLKFGHHGANHPVMELSTRKVEITSQNHNFAVPLDYFEKPDFPMKLTHLNLNDNTCEGMMHKQLPVFSVQYHPEASPGPHDSRYLFNQFVELMEEK